MPRQYLAAAASLLIVASLASPILTRGFRDTPPVGTPDTSLAPTVSDPVTPTPPVVAVATGLSVDGGFADLSDDALTMLLAELEALEGTVAAEPTTLRKPIVETPEGF